jgi:hypothetical protein
MTDSSTRRHSALLRQREGVRSRRDPHHFAWSSAVASGSNQICSPIPCYLSVTAEDVVPLNDYLIAKVVQRLVY